MTLSITQSLEIALSADKLGKWDEAHSIVAGIKHPLAYEIHAYLHRKTGDIENACYWYNKAGMSPPKGTLSEEYKSLIDELERIKKKKI